MSTVVRWLKKAWSSRWTPVVIVCAAFAAWYVGRRTVTHATYQLDGEMLVRGNPNLREVCLTFDDGPHPETANAILDTLKAEGVRATFFVVGRVVEEHPELVRRMMAEGHEVGNHTYSHKRLNQMPVQSARQEIAACAATVKRATGAGMTLLRPPGMEYNNTVLHLAQEMGYVTVHWNVVAADYAPVAPETIVERVLRQTKDGSVILLHDSPDTAVALKTLIRTLKVQGYRFVTTTQMLARLPRPVIVATNAYAVAPDQVEPKPGLVTSKPRRPVLVARPTPAHERTAPSVRRRPVLDEPAWDGRRDSGSEGPGRDPGESSEALPG